MGWLVLGTKDALWNRQMVQQGCKCPWVHTWYHRWEIKSGLGLRNHSKFGAVTTILRAIRILYTYQKQCSDYCQYQNSCSCQNTKIFAYFTGYTRYMPKSICSVKNLTSKGSLRNIKWSKHFLAWGSNSFSQKQRHTVSQES